jgi:Ser/Thr protein kinase RdoA (MazF antagonist)
MLLYIYNILYYLGINPKEKQTMKYRYVCKNIDECCEAGQNCVEEYDNDLGQYIHNDCDCGNVVFIREDDIE